ncbi:MAG TPA: hypothetical protein VER83_06610 [Candidatus Nanopelagicales bacterium]|nr:hypothetical protein [Candidatus Nanopelagicales bacterium]
MNAIELLRNRSASVTTSVAGQVAELGGIDIIAPVAPGTSPIALTLWHVPRAQDWLVNTCLRGVGEVADRFGTGLPHPERYGFGTGLSPEEARQAAAAVQLPPLLDYASAVGDEIDAWLGSLDEADLDAVPPFQARQRARAAYVTPGALAEVEGLNGLTVGVLLLRPGLSHLVRHLGEVETLAQIARSRA